MEQFLRQLQTIPEAAELIRRVEEGGCPAAVSGLQPVQRACVGAAVGEASVDGAAVGAGWGAAQPIKETASTAHSIRDNSLFMVVPSFNLSI